jgi:hypothetical protein
MNACAILAFVRRAGFAVFLTLLTFQVSGLAASCDDGSCDESCPTDLSGGQCPPNCHYCSCCSLPTVLGSTTAALVTPAAGRNGCRPTAECLPSPEPADILHVPKLLA